MLVHVFTKRYHLAKLKIMGTSMAAHYEKTANGMDWLLPQSWQVRRSRLNLQQ